MNQSSNIPDLVSTPGEISVSSGEAGSSGSSSSSGGFKRSRMFNRRNYDPIGKENIDPNYFMFEVQLTPDSACSKRSPKKAGKCRRSPLAPAPRNKKNGWQYERLR
jgi:hypothetical protein